MPSKERIEEKMQALAKLLGVAVRDTSHLAQAMYCERQGRDNYTNDAMATLGDAVLKLIWSEYFFDKGFDKDQISAHKADMENNATLKRLCEKIGIYDYAYNDLYFGDEALPHSYGPRRPEHDFYLEAVIAAIYRDQGLAYTRDWVLNFWQKHADAIVPKGTKPQKQAQAREN
ncbi:MAG: hypothetical protein IJA78_00490 [Clostridia bacterium]|nr:hypothetical protein [Clostridia bacterium]